MQQDFDKLREALSDEAKPSDVGFWFTPGAGKFAGGLSDAFSDTGWTTIAVTPYSSTFTPPDNTAVIRPANPDALASVEKALSQAAIPFERRPADGGGGGAISEIWIKAPPM